jgi:hypothetical protein
MSAKGHERPPAHRSKRDLHRLPTVRCLAAKGRNIVPNGWIAQGPNSGCCDIHRFCLVVPEPRICTPAVSLLYPFSMIRVPIPCPGLSRHDMTCRMFYSARETASDLDNETSPMFVKLESHEVIELRPSAPVMWERSRKTFLFQSRDQDRLERVEHLASVRHC